MICIRADKALLTDNSVIWIGAVIFYSTDIFINLMTNMFVENPCSKDALNSFLSNILLEMISTLLSSKIQIHCSTQISTSIEIKYLISTKRQVVVTTPVHQPLYRRSVCWLIVFIYESHHCNVVCKLDDMIEPVLGSTVTASGSGSGGTGGTLMGLLYSIMYHVEMTKTQPEL